MKCGDCRFYKKTGCPKCFIMDGVDIWQSTASKESTACEPMRLFREAEEKLQYMSDLIYGTVEDLQRSLLACEKHFRAKQEAGK